MQIGSEVIITAKFSSFYGLRGVIIGPPEYDMGYPHWKVKILNVKDLMLFSERSLELL